MINPFNNEPIMNMEQFDTYSETFPRLEHVFKDPSNPRSQFRGTKKLTVVLQRTLERLSSSSVDIENPDWNRIYEGLLENGTTEEKFLETFQRLAKLGDALTNQHVMIQMFGEERKDSLATDETRIKHG